MSLLQLRSIVTLQRSRFISSSVVKAHHLKFGRDSNLRWYLLRTTTSHFICTRQFSYTGFYTSVSESAPVITLQKLLLDLHESSGLPWWGLIMLTTLSIRTLIVFPLAIHQNQVISRLVNIDKEVKELVPRLNLEVNMLKRQHNWDEKHCKKVFKISLRRLHNKFVVRDNCHSFKIVLLGLFQIPVWICFSVALRNLTAMAYNLHPAPGSVETLKTEGLLWFPDLTCPDPFIIPLLLLTVNLGLTEVHALRQIGKGSFLQKFFLNTSRVLIAVVVVAATVNPTSVSFYWLCSSTFGLVQSILLISPNFRRTVGIPSTGKESSTPFQDIATNFQKRLQKYSRNS